MTLAGFAAYSAALAIAAAIPGPGIIALVARALGSGARSTVPMAVGLAIGDIVYLTAAVMGLAFIAQTFGTAFLVVKYAGIAYLLYLAFKLWNAGPAAERVEARKGEGPLASFLSGLLVTLGNPKVMVFYLALLPTILDLRTVSRGDLPGARRADPHDPDDGAAALCRARRPGAGAVVDAARFEAPQPHGGRHPGRCGGRDRRPHLIDPAHQRTAAAARAGGAGAAHVMALRPIGRQRETRAARGEDC